MDESRTAHIVNFAETILMRCISLLIFVFFFSCNSPAQTANVAEADAFEAALHTDPAGIQLLDVRTAGEFKTGHIKNALQADWNNSSEFQQRVQALDKNRPVYVYCLSGPRSNEAAKWLAKNGYQIVVELKGGILQWKRAGKTVEKTEQIPQMTPLQYQQQIAGKEYVLVDFGADWCPPCRKMEPDLNLFLSRHPEISFLKIDAGVHTDLMKQLQVSGIPTLLLLKNGVELWRNTGVLNTVELEDMWKRKK